MKIIFTSKRSIGMFALIIVSILLLTLPNKYLYPIVLCFIGSVICLDGVIKLTFLNRNTSGNLEFGFDLIEGIMCMIVGAVVVKFYKYPYATMVCGIIYAIIPIIRILLSRHKLNQFVCDILKYVGVVILITSIDRVFTVRLVVFIVFMSIATLIFLTLLVKMKRIKNGEYIEQQEE